MYQEPLERLENRAAVEAAEVEMGLIDDGSTRAIMIALASCAILLALAAGIYQFSDQGYEPQPAPAESEVASGK